MLKLKAIDGVICVGSGIPDWVSPRVNWNWYKSKVRARDFFAFYEGIGLDEFAVTETMPGEYALKCRGGTQFLSLEGGAKALPIAGEHENVKKPRGKVEWRDGRGQVEREVRMIANDVFREMCEEGEDRSAWLVPGLGGSDKATPVTVVACMGKFSMVEDSPGENLHRVASDRLHKTYAAALKAVRGEA